MAILEARDVSKRYEMGRQVMVSALTNVDLKAERGEFVAIMGPSGSGKSTLLHVLGAMDRPTSGEIVLEGQALSALKERELTLVRRRKIGFVFQFFNLIPTLNVEENILLPVLIDGQSKRNLQAWLDELLNKVGLEQRRSHRPEQLSGGEQQRVAIARALIAEPKIILADEPTGNLDSTMSLEIVALLKQLAVRYGQALVLVTHDLRVAREADRVVQLRDGRVCDTANETVHSTLHSS